MSAFTHTEVRKKLQELERPPREERDAQVRQGYRECKEVMVNLGRALNGGTRRVMSEEGITAVSADTMALGLLAGLFQEHRYLQNELIQVFVTVLGNLAAVEGEDARNAFGLSLCRSLRSSFGDSMFWKDSV